MCNDIIVIIKEIRTTDAYGDEVVENEKREVFADVKSVGMKESYEARALGLRPEYTFVIADYYDYDDEDLIEYDNKVYRVLRTFRKGFSLEITVTRDGSS